MDLSISLIIATRGRKEPLSNLLTSLLHQIDPPFEVIVVDQNPQGYLNEILSPFISSLPLIHLPASPGVSRARNLGIQKSRGEIVGFPDDDCTYPPDLLRYIKELFHTKNPLGGVSGKVLFPGGGGLARYPESGRKIHLYNAFFTLGGSTVFYRKKVVEEVGGFDEELGPGAETPWGSSEDIDLGIRVLKKGYTLYYDPRIVIYHPSQLPPSFRLAFLRGIRYGRGIGKVLHKHRYPLSWKGYHLLRSAGGAFVSFITGKIPYTFYHMGAFLGKGEGILNRVFLPWR
jgi:GT2 family glycosyltransferase